MIRVAIVGAGIGRSHLVGYQALPEHFQVTTVCDLDRERAHSIIGEADIQVETEFDKVLADDSIDLIDICLPPNLHFSHSKAALEAGKHVVCEKPLVPSLAEADALGDVMKRTGKLLTPVFQYRYGPAMAQIKALKDAGIIGDAYAASVETHWDRDAEYYAVDWRGTWAGENGGAVLGHAIHNHDLLTSVMGPVASLSATATTRVNDIEVEDCASVCFTMTSGAVATSSITLGAAGNMSRLRFCFDGLTAESGTEPYSPMTGQWTFTAREPRKQEQVKEVLARVPEVPTEFTGFLLAFADRLATGSCDDVTFAAGRQSIELVTAIYHAARTGGTVSLPLTSAHPLYSSWVDPAYKPAVKSA